MSASKSTTIAPVASAFFLAGILMIQVVQMRTSTRMEFRLNEIEARTPQIPPRWEYEVFVIGDAEWGTRALAIGESGWEIVTARRASDSSDNVAYECIAKRLRD